MKRRARISLAAPIAGAALLAAAASHLALSAQSKSAEPDATWSRITVRIPTSAALYPAGSGAAIANSQCLICHSAGMVLSQPSLSQAQWTATINKQRDAYGAPLPADQVTPLAAYLSELTAAASAARLDTQPKPREQPSAPMTRLGAPDGPTLFATHCEPCHQAAGAGIPGTLPPLAASNRVSGPDASVVQILLHGVQGTLTVNGIAYQGAMPPFGSDLSDAEIAAVLTFVRGQWGNHAGAIDTTFVSAQRAATAGRSEPWAGDSDLDRIK
jgi:mono/diheme cytochrome c family protein